MKTLKLEEIYNCLVENNLGVEGYYKGSESKKALHAQKPSKP